MENSLTDSPPIDALTTTTSPSDLEKRPESCLESANSPQVNDGSTAPPRPSMFTLITNLTHARYSPISPSYSLNVAPMASPTPTAVVPAPSQLVGMSSRKRKASKQTNKRPSKEECDQIYIDTTDLCTRIAYELTQHSIPQSIFAERILNRSQGTLSDLLKNPKPWGRVHTTGRQTFLRMFDWLKQPLLTRLRILDLETIEPDEMEKDTSVTTSVDAANASGSVSAAVAQFAGKKSSVTRKPRTVFTSLQKTTLEEIVKETCRPSRDIQVMIAQHLKLDLATVSNYFMNARRRNKEKAAAAVDASPAQLPLQLDGFVNDHASYYKPQDAAEVGSGN